MCPQCGRKNETDKALCADCYVKDQPRHQALYRARLDGGLCLYCGADREGNARYCPKCKKKRADRQRERIAERKAKGLCARCGKRKPRKGLWSCAKCGQRDSDNGRRRRAPITDEFMCGECGKNEALPDLTTCHDCREMTIRVERRYRYGISERDQMLLWNAQGGFCACCEGVMPSEYKAQLDHDHATGQVRGYLCLPCNIRVGVYETRYTDVAAYLASPPAPDILEVDDDR